MEIYLEKKGKTVNNLVKDFMNFLNEKGFESVDVAGIVQVPSENYKFASQIFVNKQILLPFLCEMAQNVSEPMPLRYSAGNSIDANKLKNFLEGLKKESLIDYEVMGDGLEFRVSIPVEENKRRFFRSDWAEQCFRYGIAHVVSEFCSGMGNLSYRFFQGVKIRRKGESELFTELDLVVQIEKRFYVFEVKSGPWVRILQWAAREQAFVTKDGPCRVIVCTIYDNIPAAIFEPQILMTIGGLKKRLKRLLRSDFKG